MSNYGYTIGFQRVKVKLIFNDYLMIKTLNIDHTLDFLLRKLLKKNSFS